MFMTTKWARAVVLRGICISPRGEERRWWPEPLLAILQNFAKTATNIAILSIFRATCNFPQFFVLLMFTFLMFHGYPCEYSFVLVDFSPVHPCWGDFQRAAWRSQSVVHHEKEPFHDGSEALSSNLLLSTYISRPLDSLEAMARCLELNWRFQLSWGREIFGLYSSKDLERLE